MAEYIHKEKLIKRLEVSPLFLNIKTSGSFVCDGVIDIVNKQPSADVVKVVRCKDCIFRNREDCAMFYRCDCGEQHTWETNNDFCSYGERRHEE